MNPYITGTMIRAMREKKSWTQAQLAEALHVSDKAVSKWETGKGYPDITLLESIASVFSVSVAELFAGTAVENTNRSANMVRSKLYRCPVCGNVLFSVGEASLCCHGIALMPLEAETPDEAHPIAVEPVEDEYFISVAHEMSKTHYITFIAAIYRDRVQIIKLYPESNAEVRIPRRGLCAIYYDCNRDGCFRKDLFK